MSTPAERQPAGLLALAAAALALGAIGAAVEDADVFSRLRFAVQRDANELPSTRAVSAREVVRGLPLLSLYLKPADLKEILDNKMQHGRAWERTASISYFDGGRLLFAGEAGARIHGGGSRITSPRQGFRLFFRRQYGTLQFAPGVLFGPESDPLKRLVVHNDVRADADGRQWHLVNPLAYDLARRIGGITPETRPARFFLNGEDQGLYVLTEHFDDEYFATHMPGRRITMELADMEALRGTLDGIRPLTMQAVAEHIDLDNLTSWFLAVVFAATRDAYQGPGQFLDEDRARGRWFWITWDLDQSFRNWDLESFQYLLERIGEAPRGRRASEPRGVVLTTLIAEDAGFREYLAGRIDTMLNHQLTREFVEERRAHYATVAMQFGVSDTEYIRRQREFLERRPGFVRTVAEQWLNTEPGVPVSVRRPGGGPLLVDGFEKGDTYEGTYFPGREVVVRVAGEPVRWYVNGALTANGTELRVRADRALRIVALTGREELPAATPSPAAEAAAEPPPRPAAIEWRRIPAGDLTLGCQEGDDCESNEQPRHVRIDRPFEMMATEVSVDQYRVFATGPGRRTPRQPHWSDPTHPVVNVTYDEAAAFCTAAGGRLPTEIEWEYAARGGGRGEAAPSTPRRDAVNSRGIEARDTWGMTAPVASFTPGAFQLHDMLGNVWEWTSSAYRDDPASADPRADAAAERPDNSVRTIRGGSWDNPLRNLRVWKRVGVSTRGRHNLYVGIRCAR